MEIALAIKYIHPTLEFWIDYKVEDHWNWPVLTWYNTETLQPTQPELEIAWVEVEALQEAEQTKKDKRTAILEVASIPDQLNKLAETLEILAEWNTDTRLDSARNMFLQIKNIRNN